MAKMEQFEQFIREKIVDERWSHGQLKEYFTGQFPGEKGFSIRSIERFCRSKHIHKTSRAGTEIVDEAVSEAVAKVIMNNPFYCIHRL